MYLFAELVVVLCCTSKFHCQLRNRSKIYPDRIQGERFWSTFCRSAMICRGNDNHCAHGGVNYKITTHFTFLPCNIPNQLHLIWFVSHPTQKPQFPLRRGVTMKLKFMMTVAIGFVFESHVVIVSMPLVLWWGPPNIHCLNSGKIRLSLVPYLIINY